MHAASGWTDLTYARTNVREIAGDGAFYGPKIDIKVFDAMKRVHQCATIQPVNERTNERASERTNE